MNKMLRSFQPPSVRSTVTLGFLLMVFGAVAAVAMTPRDRVADHRNYDLEHIVPTSFAGWREEEGDKLVLPDPSANTLADKIYNRVLARTYRGSSGEHVMLVIAYGGDQSDQLQLHRPEVCYAANGYHVEGLHFTRQHLAGYDLVMARLDTSDHYGHEDVSYWMRVGDRQVTTNMDRQWVKLVSGLHGVIPDGVLVRVSSRTGAGDADRQYAIHDRFIADLVAQLDGNARQLLIGRGAQGASPVS